MPLQQLLWLLHSAPALPQPLLLACCEERAMQLAMEAEVTMLLMTASRVSCSLGCLHPLPCRLPALCLLQRPAPWMLAPLRTQPVQPCLLPRQGRCRMWTLSCRALASVLRSYRSRCRRYLQLQLLLYRFQLAALAPLAVLAAADRLLHRLGQCPCPQP